MCGQAVAGQGGGVRPFVMMAVLAAICVATYAVAHFAFPCYAAESFVECIGPSPEAGKTLSADDGSVAPADGELEVTLASVPLLMTSDAVLLKTLDAPTVRNTAWYQRIDPANRVSALRREIRTQRVPKTNFIRVSASMRSPDDPHRIVNEVVQSFLATADKRLSPFPQALTDHVGELNDLSKQIAASDDEVRALLSGSNMELVAAHGDFAADAAALASQCADQEDIIGALELQTRELRTLLDQYLSADRPIPDLEDRFVPEVDPHIAQLDNKAYMMEQEIAFAEMDESCPEETALLHDRLEEAREELKTARRERYLAVTAQRQEQIRVALSNSQNALLAAYRQLPLINDKLVEAQRRQIEYVSLLHQREALTARKDRAQDIIAFLDRQVRNDSAVAFMQAVAAQPPDRRSFPRPYMLLSAVILPMAWAVKRARHVHSVGVVWNPWRH
jgi:hypothetical protein